LDIQQITEKVLDLLDTYCGDDPDRIRDEIFRLGDAEVDSIYFVEIAPVLAGELGIQITVSHIDQYAKRSFNDFCGLLVRLVLEQR
jgi:acyl carrier protein